VRSGKVNESRDAKLRGGIRAGRWTFPRERPGLLSVPPFRTQLEIMELYSRRTFLAGLAAASTIRAQASLAAEGRLASASARLAEIEAREGGRLGVTVLDADAGSAIEHRADERFPMCSTFKLLAAAATLKRVEQGDDRLDRKIAYGAGDLLEYAPVTRAHVGEGGMTLAALCAAAIDWSDNTAANLILDAIGGPPGLTAFARSLGDEITRLDRNEPSLNEATPGDQRDTTTPRAMAADMRRILLGDDILVEGSRGQLEAWLVDDKVGDKRLRAGLPPSWKIGDKTGSGDHGTANAIGILRPPGRAPLLAAVYYTESDKPMDARNAIHKEIGSIIAETF
jgi:beta-lactamase class A